MDILIFYLEYLIFLYCYFNKIKNVKAKYLAESPKRDWIRIDLRYQNRVLKDEDEVPPDGSTLTFESVIMTPEAKRRSIPTRILPPYLNLEEDNTTEFVADSERVFKTETARALVPLKTNNNNKNKTISLLSYVFTFRDCSNLVLSL